MSNFVVELKLKTEIYQEDILEKRFEIARKIQIALAQCKNIKNEELREQSLKELNLLYKEYGFFEYRFHADVKEFQHHFFLKK